MCVGNSRQKPLCCEAPPNTDPFLPAMLYDLFPEVPSSDNIALFDYQSLSTSPSLAGENDKPGAFLSVIVDGPPDAVANLNKRDGSHLQFLTRGIHQGTAAKTTHFVCTDDTQTSNCDDMHLNGLEGTVIRMPDHMGFAQWAVAHAVAPSNLTTPPRIARRSPKTAQVFELTYSYDFSRVKRDSGDVYFRVDYSDNPEYFNTIVEAPHYKRSLERRFFSEDDSSYWIERINTLRGWDYIAKDPNHRFLESTFDTTLLGDDGYGKGCDDGDGFLNLKMKGAMSSKARYGYTIIGKLAPTLETQEAIGYYDTDLAMSGSLSVDSKASLNFDNNSLSLFSDAIRNDAMSASHPGIVSFTPELNAEITLDGSGELDGQFKVDFEVGSSGTIQNHAPTFLNKLYNKGGASTRLNRQNPFDGTMSSNETQYRTLLQVRVELRSTMIMELFDGKTKTNIAGADFLTSASIP